MSVRLIVGIGIAAMAASSTAAQTVAQKKSWKCSAPGLVSSSYDGGGSAYVHLQGFSSGGTYAVTKRGNVATGTTANGTKFTCRQS